MVMDIPKTTNSIDSLKKFGESLKKEFEDKKTISAMETTGEIKSSNSDFISFTPSATAAEKGLGDIFSGHFDLNMEKFSSRGVSTDNFQAYSSQSLSFNLSFDMRGYIADGLTDQEMEDLKSVFTGEDFKEFEASFFSLSEGEGGLDNFSQEIDDIFSKISETLELDSNHFDGIKKMFMFSAVMFVDQLEQRGLTDITPEIKDNSSDMFKEMGILNMLTGDETRGKKHFIDSLIAKPERENFNNIKDILDIFNSDGMKSEENRENSLIKRLQSLSKQAKNFEKYML